MTLFNWGESPSGTWQFIVETRDERKHDDEESPQLAEQSGQLSHLSLVLYGTAAAAANSDENNNSMPATRLQDDLKLPSTPELSSEQVVEIYERELIRSRRVLVAEKRQMSR